MAAKKTTTKKQKMYVIVRCKDAGVHAGTLEKQTKEHLVLSDTRRIWYWNGAASLSEIARFGLNPQKSTSSKISAAVRSNQLRQTDVCEVLECSPEGEASIVGAPVWRA